jgi:hypothetical protein
MGQFVDSWKQMSPYKFTFLKEISLHKNHVCAHLNGKNIAIVLCSNIWQVFGPFCENVAQIRPQIVRLLKFYRVFIEY